MADSGIQGQIPEEATTLRQELTKAQTALAGSQVEKNVADSVRKDLELAVGRLTQELHAEAENMADRARKDERTHQE